VKFAADLVEFLLDQIELSIDRRIVATARWAGKPTARAARKPSKIARPVAFSRRPKLTSFTAPTRRGTEST